jgi:predicted  nucleic acid-binding Zn-ribbon protein
VKEKEDLERELTVAKDETMALRSTVAQMTAQSYGITTELEATKVYIIYISKIFTRALRLVRTYKGLPKASLN